MSKRKPVSPRLDVSSQLGTSYSFSGPYAEIHFEEVKANGTQFSDGIARVHGMNNVQAEELVE